MAGTRSPLRIALALAASGVLTLGLAAGATANQFVYNSSGSTLAMTGSIGQDGGDEAGAAVEPGAGGESGYVEAWQNQGEPAQISAGVATVEELLCEGDPQDPEDDYSGIVASGFYLSGDAELTFARQYESGMASATVDLAWFTYNDCTGDYEETVEPGVPVTFEMVGTSDLIRTSDTSAFLVPGEFNDRYTFRSTYRDAMGTLTVGEMTFDVPYGQIGKSTWSEHGNG